MVLRSVYGLECSQTHALILENSTKHEKALEFNVWKSGGPHSVPVCDF